MITSKYKFTQLQYEIFRLFCIKSGEKLNQREISRLLKVSPTAIAKSLILFKENNLLIIEKNKKMNLNLISLNRNQESMKLKQIENLKLIYESNLIEFLEESFPGATIILFGSYSRGEDLVNSDIDIAIIFSKQKEINLNKYENLLERKINLNFYPSFKEINKELRENLFNGIVLSGGIEL